MQDKPLSLRLFFLILATSLASIAVGQERNAIKEPYSLSLQASRSAGGIEVTATIRSVDPQKYPLPTFIKQLVADPDDGAKNRLKKYTADNLTLVNGQASFLLQGYDECQGFHVKVHVKVDGWHDEHLEDDIHVFSRPNLRIHKIDAPEQVPANTPFTVQATIREVKGDSDATTTVTLYEGSTVLTSLENVAVPKGGSANVSFPGIMATTAGRHSYSVKISNTVPPEFDLTNNSRSFTVNVWVQSDLLVEKLKAPDEVFVNTPFEIQAYVRQTDKSTKVKATVSLFDGASLIGSFAEVEVHSGSLERVTFRGITTATPGQHIYTVSITNCDPPESDGTNNSSTVTVQVVTKPDIRVESASAVSPVFLNTSFDIDVVVREFGGQSGASATVTLYEGRDRQASPIRVLLTPGGTAHAIFQNIKERTPGVHNYTVKISNVQPCESNDEDNSFEFSLTVVVRPDLKVDEVTSPSSVSTGSSFSVDALIKEVDGQTGASATVTLSEGTSVLGTFTNVSVSAAGSVTVSFTGIVASTSGTHSYTVKISNAVPSESDVSNNSYCFSVSAAAKPDLRVDNVTVPSTVQVGTPFTLSASITEYIGIVGATAGVTLYDGAASVGATQTISVPAGGNVDVTFSGVVISTAGTHTFTVKTTGAVPAEMDTTNNDYAVTVNVLPKPDLTVDQLIVPAQINANTPFDVQAVIRELTGQSGATASVSLYEGATLLAGPLAIVVPAGGTVTATFQGLTATTSGTHTYTAVISGATPGESDVTNNQAASTTTVSEQSPMTFNLSYIYNQSVNLTQITSTGGWYSLDSTSSESASMSYTATVSSTSPPSSPIASVTWTISTPAGTFDQVSLANLTRTGGDATTDYYSALNVNNKGTDFLMMVDRGSGSIQVSLEQAASYDEHVIIVRPETNISISTGIRENVIRPENSLTVSLTIQGGENTWGGTTTIPVSPRVLTNSSGSVIVSPPNIEDGTVQTTVSSSQSYQASGPGAPSLAASTPAASIAANEDFASPPITVEFNVTQNFPNPFNPSTTFEFALPKSAYVTLKVYDMLAREVATVVSRDYEAGLHRVRWNASSLPSGMYIYRVRAGDFVAQKKLMLVK